MNYQLPFLILCVTIEIYAGCPTECTCTDTDIDCVSKNLEFVPSFEHLENYPLIIDLSGNSLSIINNTHFSFVGNTEVVEIYLNNSELIVIQEFAFSGLESLQELYLSDNLLHSIPVNLVESNENMVLLHLSNNQFTDMPVINAPSLEVLALANSGISRITPDAFEGLPNLRILLLSENNLKIINPATFQHVNSLFYIQLLYNPWQCDCKTVKLFDFLTEMKFVDLTEPVQCLQEGDFREIYDEEGVSLAFQGVCDGFNGSFDEEEEKMEVSGEILKPKLETKRKPEMEENQNFSSFYYAITLGSVVIISLLIGAICGSCITLRYINLNLRQTESTKELLDKTGKNLFL